MSRILCLLLAASLAVAAGCNKKEEAKPAKDGSRLPGGLDKDGGVRGPAPAPSPPKK